MSRRKIELLDCTLRDGAYIVDSIFGEAAIRGIIKKMQDANADIIEVGWLKDKPHEVGSSFYHVPSDVLPYMLNRQNDIRYVAMIDWDRYNLDNLPQCDGKSIDAIRVVFPHGKHHEGIEVGKRVRDKGYGLFFQAANTLAYSNDDLRDLAQSINEAMPISISVVDTFGAMYEEDLERILEVLDEELNPAIKLGFHSHNNQQLSFALTRHFVDYFRDKNRSIIVDASLCGMGRGAGNATTELVTSFLNRKYNGNYDLNAVMDAIDTYMTSFQERYTWGYSTPYFIAGLYQCHVNNIAYLLNNHRTNAKDMRNIIESLDPADRRKYDYDLLEQKYLENQSRKVDDEATVSDLSEELKGKEVLLIAPGKSIETQRADVEVYIAERDPVRIAVNAINPGYEYDYLLFVNSTRYEYARNTYGDAFDKCKKIAMSNVAVDPDDEARLVNFDRVVKRGWPHFDNAVIVTLRLLSQLGVKKVSIAGFDGFKEKYNESYCDVSLPTLNPDGEWGKLNDEIADMFADFVESAGSDMRICFVTDSYFDSSR